MNLNNSANTLWLYAGLALACHVFLFSLSADWFNHNAAIANKEKEPRKIVFSILYPDMTSLSSASIKTPSPGSSSPSRREEKENIAAPSSFASEREKPQKRASLKNQQATHTFPHLVLASEKKTKEEDRSKLLVLLHNAIQQQQAYPLSALMSQQSGTAIIHFTILPNGKIINSALNQSSGFANLDQAALEAVQAISPFKAMTSTSSQDFDVAVSFSLAKR